METTEDEVFKAFQKVRWAGYEEPDILCIPMKDGTLDKESAEYKFALFLQSIGALKSRVIRHVS